VLHGRKLTGLTAVLAVLSLAGAGRVAAIGRFSLSVDGDSACRTQDAGFSQSLLMKAREAEARGDVGAALSQYRAAVVADTRLADRTDSRYLGSAFEHRLDAWVKDLKAGRLHAGPAALSDASFLFRRIYGGCG
jgi:hypothetical protein